MKSKLKTQSAKLSILALAAVHCALFTAPLRAQISGAGQFGCNAVPQTATQWTSSTSVNTTQTLATNVAGSDVTVVIDQSSGSFSAGAISFQIDYGDGNLVTVNAWQVTDPTSSSFAAISVPYTLVTSTNKVFLIQMGNAHKLVLKLTTAISGSGTITPYTNLICYTTPAQVNVANAPNVNVQSNASVNVNQWDGTSLGAPSNYGTSPGAVSVPGVNAYVTNTVPVSGTFWQATQPVSLSSLPALASGSNTIGAVTQASGPWTVNLTQLDSTALGAPSDYGVSPGAVEVQGVNAAITQAVDPAPTTSSTPATSVCLLTANTTAASCKASGGNLYAFSIYNPNSSLCVMQVFNTSSVTLGTTQEILDIPVLSTGGNNLVLVHPINFSSDIYVASTTAAHGSSTCSTGMLINLFYD